MSSDTSTAGPRPPRVPVSPSVLDITELVWSERQKWLEECGYMLRPRYVQGWVPSWRGKKKVLWLRCEDGQFGHVSSLCPHLCGRSFTNGVSFKLGPVMDATRISDNQFVLLKSVKKSIHPYEVEIGRFLSSPPLADDSQNHCVPIYDVLQDPNDDDIVIIVMPLLRRYNDPRFDTIGEAVSFFSQIFEVSSVRWVPVLCGISTLNRIRRVYNSCTSITLHTGEFRRRSSIALSQPLVLPETVCTSIS